MNLVCRIFGHEYRFPCTQAPFNFVYLKGPPPYDMKCKRCGNIISISFDDFKWYGGYAIH